LPFSVDGKARKQYDNGPPDVAEDAGRNAKLLLTPEAYIEMKTAPTGSAPVHELSVLAVLE